MASELRGGPVEQDGWFVDDVDEYRFFTDQAPPRRGVWKLQLGIDARAWKPVVWWLLCAGLIGWGAATGSASEVVAGALLLLMYVGMLQSLVATRRDARVVLGRVAGTLEPHPMVPSARTAKARILLDGASVEVPVVLRNATAEQLLGEHGAVDVLVLYRERGGQFLPVLGVRQPTGEVLDAASEPLPLPRAPSRAWRRGLLALVGAGVGFLVLQWRSAPSPDPMALAEQEQVVDAWVPLVRALSERGVSAPSVLVLTLTLQDLQLETGEQIYGRLPRAIATVAHVQGRDSDDIAGEVVAEVLSPDRLPLLLQQVQDVRPKLEGLPGVRTVGALALPEPGPFAVSLRQYATTNGIPVPRTASPSEPWLALLGSLEHEGIEDPAVLLFVVRFSRVRLQSGEVLEPLGEEAAYETVAVSTGTDIVRLRQQTFRRLMMESGGLARGHVPVIDQADHARGVLRGVTTVASVEEVHPTLASAPVAPRKAGAQALGPPWKAFPEPPTSLRWRMGAGESFMDEWWPFWQGLSAEAKQQYFRDHPPPPEWQEWAQSALAAE